MKNIGRNLFLASFLFALISAIAVYFYLLSLDESKNVEVAETKTIIVASVNIPPRTIITQEMLKEVEITAESDYGSFINNPEEIVGLYSKEKIYMDERFHEGVLIVNSNNELSLKITEDKRAVSISTTLDTGVANLLKSGDFVDVFVRLPELKQGQDLVRPDIAKLILQNIEVLAIDQNMDREKEDVLEEVKTNFIVTLSVPVLDIEKLVLAENIGNLKLALRPIGKDYIYETEGAIWEELFLNDFDELKDMFPVYDVKGKGEVLIDGEKYEYDKYYFYTVEYGDTLRSISIEYYGSEENYLLLKQVNRIEDENTILAGSNLKIPILDNMVEEGDNNE